MKENEASHFIRNQNFARQAWARSRGRPESLNRQTNSGYRLVLDAEANASTVSTQHRERQDVRALNNPTQEASQAASRHRLGPDEAAFLIQKKWKSYRHNRKSDIRVVRELARVIGHQPRTAEEAIEALKHTAVIQVRGKDYEPLSGHSIIFLGPSSSSVELLFTNERRIALNQEILVHLPNESFTFILDGYGKMKMSTDDYASIVLTSNRRDTVGRISHCFKEDRPEYFVVNPKYTERLLVAVGDECNYMASHNFRYDIMNGATQYTCNTFTRNVLSRMITGKLGF